MSKKKYIFNVVMYSQIEVEANCAEEAEELAEKSYCDGLPVIDDHEIISADEEVY